MPLSAGAMLLSQTFSRFWPQAETDPAPAGRWSPDVDAVERRDSFVARIDLPGTPPSEIHVELSEDEVTVYGQRPRNPHERDDTWSHAEPGVWLVLPRAPTAGWRVGRSRHCRAA